MHYVYVLRSASDSGFYIGYSSNLRRRLAEHQAGCAIATSYRGPWRLIYYEAYLEEADARGREEFLKSGAGRKHLQKQCRQHFAKSPPRSKPSAGCYRVDAVSTRMGHDSLETTQLYTHVMQKPGLGVTSPLDGLGMKSPLDGFDGLAAGVFGSIPPAKPPPPEGK